MLNPSFHRIMSKEEAEQKLENHGSSNTCYLTRYDAAEKKYYLSVLTQKEDAEECKPITYHFILKITRKGLSNRHRRSRRDEDEDSNFEPEYELEGTQMKFDRVSELLNFYKTIPVNFQVSSIGEEVKSDFTVSYSRCIIVTAKSF